MKRRGILASAAALLGLPFAPKPREPYRSFQLWRWDEHAKEHYLVHEQTCGELSEHQKKNVEVMAQNFRVCVMDMWEDRTYSPHPPSP